MTTGVLIAHPDDEAWAFTTPLQQASLSSVVPVFCSTLGQSGADFSGQKLKGDALGAVRLLELKASLDILCGKERWSLRSSVVPDASGTERLAGLTEEVNAWAQAHKLSRIVTWGPAGGYGHVDHVACFEAAFSVSKALGIELWCSVLPQLPANELFSFLQTRVRLPIVLDSFSGVRADEREDQVFAVDAPTKLRALACHATQVGSRPPEHFVQKALTSELLKREAFMVLQPHEFE